MGLFCAADAARYEMTAGVTTGSGGERRAPAQRSPPALFNRVNGPSDPKVSACRERKLRHAIMRLGLPGKRSM